MPEIQLECYDGKYLLSESSLGRIYVYIEEYQSERFLHCRRWYHDKKDGTWKPTAKGFAVPSVVMEKFVQIVARLLNDWRGG